MRIIQPSAELLRPQTEEGGLIALRAIEAMARISHKSEDAQTNDSWRRFLQAVVIEHGDWSVVEHATASVLFRVDRGITHELVRHRLFSYTQESTRFVNGSKKYPDGLEFIVPDQLQGTLWSWSQAVQTSETEYLQMLKEGHRPQEARSVLPNALASTIGMTGNLRAWRWFFLARTSRESHPDMRRVTIPLLAVFKQRIPLLYDDIEPEARQIDNFKKAH
jgi:thymidylate synthase (FAD)